MKHIKLFEDFGVVKNSKDLDPKLASEILSSYASGNWEFTSASAYENAHKAGEYNFSFYGGRVNKDAGDVIDVVVYKDDAKSDIVHIEDPNSLALELTELYNKGTLRVD